MKWNQSKLGTFENNTGILIAADPCQKVNATKRQALSPVKTGTWTAFAVHHPNRRDVAHLIIAHNDYAAQEEKKISARRFAAINIGVDAAALGFFSPDVFRNDALVLDNGEKYREAGDKWYSHCVSAYKNSVGAGIIQGGTVATTNNDGVFPCYYAKDDTGKIIWARMEIHNINPHDITGYVDNRELENAVNELCEDGEVSVSDILIAGQDDSDGNYMEVYLPGMVTSETSGFEGDTFNEMFSSIVESVNQMLVEQAENVMNHRLIPDPEKTYHACVKCGGVELIPVELRVKDSKLHAYHPLNDQFLLPVNQPETFKALFCNTCQNFTEARIVSGVLNVK